jgi:hypothetical protein
MARKLSELSEFTGTPADTDEIEVLDKSDHTYGASGTNKRWSIANMVTWLQTLFAPLSHNHSISQVTDLQDALVDKQDALAEGAFEDGDKTKLDNIEAGATADQTDSEIETAYNNRVSVASQGDAEAGTSTTVYRWTPQRIAQAIAALQTGSIQNNFTATTDPATTDDTSAGYSIGSVWVNTTADEAYRCVDNTASAAVWVKTSLTTDELATVATTGSYNDLADKPTIPTNAPTISSGAGVPSSTPAKVGDIYIDTTNDDAYIAVGTASGADWEKSNDGAGGGGDANITYSATEPSSPSDGDLWVDTSEILDTPVRSADITSIVALTQAEYDALTPVATTLYVITDA